MSTASREYLLTSCTSSQQASVYLQDVKPDSSNILKTYKNGGIAADNTLNYLVQDFILVAEQKKPLLHLWQVNSEQPSKSAKLILPKPTTVLTASPDSHFLAAGIDSKLLIWHLPTGNLLSIQRKHVLPITNIKFSDLGGFLVSTCQAGMVITYRFADLVLKNNKQLAQTEIGQVEPLYVRKDHTDVIIDLRVGNFEMDASLATISKDCTCRLNDLLTGDPLLQIVYSELLSCVMFDSLAWYLCVGTNSGVIYKHNLQSPPKALTVHNETDELKKLKLVGHQKRVTCLDMNFSNQYLASGSEDNTIIIWKFQTGQKLSKIEHKGAITNVMFIRNHTNLFAEKFTPRLQIRSLKRYIEDSEDSGAAVLGYGEDAENRLREEKETDLLWQKRSKGAYRTD